MCGIVGYISNKKKEALSHVINGLSDLEYRGYDSSGVAILEEGKVVIVKAVGELDNLKTKLKKMDFKPSGVAIGHTRWATHGEVTEVNAHPHKYGNITLVHNGIIENFQELKNKYQKLGYQFKSETDTEVVAVAMYDAYKKDNNLTTALAKVQKEIKGAYAIVGIVEKDKRASVGGEATLGGGDVFGVGTEGGVSQVSNNTHLEEEIFFLKNKAPMVIGKGADKFLISSDTYVFDEEIKENYYVKDLEYGIIDQEIVIFDNNDQRQELKFNEFKFNKTKNDKGSYEYYMEKEIHEQPYTIAKTINSFVDLNTFEVIDESMQKIATSIAKNNQLYLSACGTAYYASLVGKYLLEDIAQVGVSVDFASEVALRNATLPTGGNFMVISQSGETADTLAAVEYAEEQKQNIYSILNTVESTIGRKSQLILATKAGVEIGVASTKAFTTQTVVLMLLSIIVAKVKNIINQEQYENYIKDLSTISGGTTTVLENTIPQIKAIAENLATKKSMLYLGRGYMFPIAIEGALKLKEISYLYSEGYPAGEIKHGHLALVEEGFPVIFLAPNDRWLHKTLSNVKEVSARAGEVYIATNKELDQEYQKLATQIVELPKCSEIASIVIFTIFVQLVAYYTASKKGTNIDKPRNLAKSVTVE